METITLQELTTKTVEAMRPYFGKPEWERIANYVKAISGGLTLSNYLNEAEVPEEKKREMLNNILRIIDAQAWDELPKVAKGQAQDTTPAPGGKKAAVVAPPTLVKRTVEAPPPAPAPVLATRESVLPVVETQPVDEPALPPINDPLLGAIFTGLLPHFLARIPKPEPMPAAVPVAAPAIDPVVLRRAVRAELANNLEALVKALRAEPSSE